MYEDIASKLNTKHIARRIITLSNVDSTNNYAKGLLQDDPHQETLILAEAQTSGRGQQDKYWFSSPGGLYMTLITDLKKVNRVTIITLCAGLACRDAINQLYQIEPKLKWVNDILIDDKKVGGILTECIHRGKDNSLLIGIGINVNNSIKNFPDELINTATSLLESTGKTFELVDVAALVCQNLEKYLDYYKKENFPVIKGLWLKYSSILGRNITFIHDNRQLEGIVLDINNDGALIIQTLTDGQHILTQNRDIVYTNTGIDF